MFMHSVSDCVASVKLQAASLSVCVCVCDNSRCWTSKIIPQRARPIQMKRTKEAQKSSHQFRLSLSLDVYLLNIIRTLIMCCWSRLYKGYERNTTRKKYNQINTLDLLHSASDEKSFSILIKKRLFSTHFFYYPLIREIIRG